MSEFNQSTTIKKVKRIAFYEATEDGGWTEIFFPSQQLAVR
jgi:hypothetical protein